MPSLSVTVTDPSLPTVTFASAGKSGFAFLTASSTAFFSGSVRLDGSATSTGLAGATTAPGVAFCSTKSVPAIVSSELSGYLIVAVPSLPTVIVVPAGNVLLP